MKSLDALRLELLEQHAGLRRLAETAIACAGRARLFEGSVPELREVLDRLETELVRHNAEEERELHAILPTIDAWGAIRDKLMDERHVAEHEALVGAIQVARAQAGPAAAAAAIGVVTKLLAHMEKEERELLHPDVLRDDLVTSGVGG